MEDPPIRILPHDLVVAVLSYLRAKDLATLREVSKTVFYPQIITTAVAYQLQFVHNYTNLPSYSSSNCNNCNNRVNRQVSSSAMRQYRQLISSSTGQSENQPETLFVREISSIQYAISKASNTNTSPGSPSITSKSYWISSTWIANAKKYFETKQLPDPITRGFTTSNHMNNSLQVNSGKKVNKQNKIRQRRNTLDSFPPHSCINLDIQCEHGGLALAKNVKRKRKIIDA